MDFVFNAPAEELKPGYRPDFSTGKAEVRTDYSISPDAHAYIEKLLYGFHPKTRLFYIHVILSDRPREEAGIPIPATTIKALGSKVYKEIKRLVEDGLLEKSDFFGWNKSYTYSVPHELKSGFFEAELSGEVSKRVDVTTGLKSRRAATKSKLHDPNRNSYGEPLKSALTTLTEGRFDLQAASTYMKAAQDEAESVRLACQRAGERGQSPEDIARVELASRARFENDLRCFMAVLDQRPRRVGDGSHSYVLAYKVAMTGRISQVRGGLQSCSRTMKAAAYSGVPDVRNYDIKSSQAYILRERFKDAGITSEWLNRYLEKNKSHYAIRIGLDDATWKKCLYALFYGASLSFSRDLHGRDLAIREAILEYVLLSRARRTPQGPFSVDEEARVLFGKFKSEIEVFYRDVQRWRKYLVTEWLDANKVSGRAGWTVRNESGVILRKRTYEGWGKEQKRRLASFVLQGIEAGFIHTLTALLPDYDVLPVSNEHDGLVTIGIIPEEAVERAKALSMAPYLVLDLKPFPAYP